MARAPNGARVFFRLLPNFFPLMVAAGAGGHAVFFVFFVLFVASCWRGVIIWFPQQKG